MTDNIPWQIDLKIHNGRVGDFLALMNEVLGDHTDSHDPAHKYVWSIDDTQTTGRISRICLDATDPVVCWSLDWPAARSHLTAIGPDFASRLLDVADPVNLVVYGEPIVDAIDGAPTTTPATTWVKSLINRGLAITSDRATTHKKKTRLELIGG